MAGAPRSIFARIAAGEIPCQKVFENEHVLAFLDIHPLADGHTLVIPKQEVAHLDQLAPHVAAELGRVLGLVARKVVQATGAPGYNVLLNNGRVAGQEVEHVHFHIVPRREIGRASCRERV